MTVDSVDLWIEMGAPYIRGSKKVWSGHPAGLREQMELFATAWTVRRKGNSIRKQGDFMWEFHEERSRGAVALLIAELFTATTKEKP